MTNLYHHYVYIPLYNGLVFLIDLLPQWAGIGVALILFTIIVKLILFPLSRSMYKTQIRMKQIEPKMKILREKYKGDTKAMSVHTMQLYKDEKVNPFSSFFSLFLIIVQFPILIALYRIFYSGGLPMIHSELLYSFVHAPSFLPSTSFFGVEIAEKSAIFAVLAGVAQFFQMKYSFAQTTPTPAPVLNTDGKDATPDIAATMATMQSQMKYIFPVIMVVIAYTVNAAIALYLITSSLFALGQEVVMRRSLKK